VARPTRPPWQRPLPRPAQHRQAQPRRRLPPRLQRHPRPLVVVPPVLARSERSHPSARTRPLKKYLIAGLLTWLPLAITIWVLLWLLGLTDSMFSWVLAGVNKLVPASGPLIKQLTSIPGLSMVVLAGLMLITGVFVTNVFGQWWVGKWDRLMSRIPIVKSIYSSVKQVSDTLFSSSGNAFREAVLVQYPRQGAWTVAFVTGKPAGEVAEHLAEQTSVGSGDTEWLSVYVPTTPNPTSGFFLLMRRDEVLSLQMSVDQALKYVISMGVVSPGAQNGNTMPAAVASAGPSDAIANNANASRNRIG
jgi:uncharacterized membrane protein